MPLPPRFSFFFFNDTATTEIYTLSLHDALPISTRNFIHDIRRLLSSDVLIQQGCQESVDAEINRIVALHVLLIRIIREFFEGELRDRKSTRLNSSHQIISYAVFCLKKKSTYA